MMMTLTLALIASALLGTGYALYTWRKRRLLRYMPPEAFRRYAHSTPQCVGIMPFMWGSRDDSGEKNAGIKSNGMAPAYEALGHGILALRGKA